MAQSIQSRAAARGYPVFDLAGQTGQGTLPDSTLPSGTAPGSPTSTWTDPNVDPASVGATLPPPEEYVLGGLMWGLSGAPDPDDTPRTHAAPIADSTLPVGEYFLEADAAHAENFDGVQLRHSPGTLLSFGQSEDVIPGSPDGPLQRLSGQVRSMGRFDGVQGYGGGAGGVNGTNQYMPLTVQDITFPGPEGNPTFLNAAEKPFLVPDADQFIATAPELPPFTGVYDAPRTSVLAQDVIAADSPLQGQAVSAGQGGLLPPAGWW
jgi:hypothetical protein